MRRIRFFRSLLVITFILFQLTSLGQHIDIGSIGKGKAFKFQGNLSANTLFYSSTTDSGSRDPFTYVLQGGASFSLYQFTVPVSYSFSNQGSNLSYDTPFDFNRLSLHPKYKWVQAHIGDVSMTFSPYTLSGHQFTGGGVTLTPKGGYTIEAMAGRLLKAVEEDADSSSPPSYKRMGYGVKFIKRGSSGDIGVSIFYGKDDENSLKAPIEDGDVTPKENIAIQLEGSVKVNDHLTIDGEYASTAITENISSSKMDGVNRGLAGLFISERASTEYHNAISGSINYAFGQSTIGLGYERIDPNYTTLGAYYFSSDLENITINGASTLFDKKVSISGNIGMERDDLNSNKSNSTQRFLMSFNLNIQASERLSISTMYSNFNTVTNTKSDQFETINDDTDLDNQADELDFKQLSQNGNINVAYKLSDNKSQPQNLSINYSLADVVNRQNGMVRIGGASTFHNVNTSYSLGITDKDMTLSLSLNGTYNTIGDDDITTWGPLFNVGKKFLDKLLNMSLTGSYNSSTNAQGSTNSVASVRVNGTYIYKEKHNLNFNATQMFRDSGQGEGFDGELTVSLGYSYSF